MLSISVSISITIEITYTESGEADLMATDTPDRQSSEACHAVRTPSSTQINSLRTHLANGMLETSGTAESALSPEAQHIQHEVRRRRRSQHMHQQQSEVKAGLNTEARPRSLRKPHPVKRSSRSRQIDLDSLRTLESATAKTPPNIRHPPSSPADTPLPNNNDVPDWSLLQPTSPLSSTGAIKIHGSEGLPEPWNAKKKKPSNGGGAASSALYPSPPPPRNRHSTAAATQWKRVWGSVSEAGGSHEGDVFTWGRKNGKRSNGARGSLSEHGTLMAGGSKRADTCEKLVDPLNPELPLRSLEQDHPWQKTSPQESMQQQAESAHVLFDLVAERDAERAGLGIAVPEDTWTDDCG